MTVKTISPQQLAELCKSGKIDLIDVRTPVEFREVVILREMEGFSYKEIADLADVPIGTVMSRLARARKQLQKRLAGEFKPGGQP